MKTYYIHTIYGEPATVRRGIVSKVTGSGPVIARKTLGEIRKDQKLSKQWRELCRWENPFYDYLKVQVPE